MVMLTRKVHRKLGRNYTFMILTDRDDLDSQIYKTFASCGVVNHDREPCRASSGKHLAGLLGQHKAYVFSLIQKFNQDVDPEYAYTQRDDIIVVTDEAHRTQYGTLALNMRTALPNASYIGFTGTPLVRDDEITRQVFGNYVSTYGFQRAMEDGATVPLYYDVRGDALGVSIGDINERIAEKLEAFEADNMDVKQELERELRRDYHIVTAEQRLDQVARDFVRHYSTAWEGGKAMLVCIDKLTCVRMYELIEKYWQERIDALSTEASVADNEQDTAYLRHQIAWMSETEVKVVVSEEQGEVDKFRQWGLDIVPHRKLIKDGIGVPMPLQESKPQYAAKQLLPLEDAFKEEAHPFRIAIVCAMWMTGFDVPCLSTLYLDKSLKAHTLMQAIARANRVHEGKTNGLIVDYCGILNHLRRALATFGGGRGSTGEAGPARPAAELLNDLDEAIEAVRQFLIEKGADLDDISRTDGFERNKVIVRCKEAANENDETRKRFEITCREVFKRFKACINCDDIHARRPARDAIDIVYKKLDQDREQADITDIIRQLQRIVDEAIEVQPRVNGESSTILDISRINFDLLRKEFARIPTQNTTVQNLRQAVEKKLQRMMAQNPLRTDLQAHYERLVEEYNQQKDRVTLEKIFDELLQFYSKLNEEQSRAMREGLDEESLAIFDLLSKSDLSAKEIKQIKQVARSLLAQLKAYHLNVDQWQDKETTRDTVKTTINNFLYNDSTGLPLNTYQIEEIDLLSEDVYRHVHRVYPTLPSPYYDSSAPA